MLCPLCKNKLITDPDEPSFIFEDAALSQIHTTKHICDNKDCELYHKSYWNDYGDFFSGNLDFKRSNELFPHNQYAAYNSIAKKHEVEIYKNGLKSKTYLSPWLTFGWLKPVIEHNYKGDEMGNILKRTYKLKFLYRSNSKEYTTYYTSGLSKLYRKINRLTKQVKNYKEKNSMYSLLQIYKWYNFRNQNLIWYEKFYKFYIRSFYRKILKLSENYTYFLDYIEKIKEITEKDYLYFEKNLHGINILSHMIKYNCYGEIIDRKIREQKLIRILKKKK